MDEAKKQKVMLAIVGVAVLGMAAWWLPGLLGGDGSDDGANAEPRARRVRGGGDKDEKADTRKDRNKNRKESVKAERKVRAASERKTTERKKRRGSKKGKKKKKKIIPAA